MDFENLETPEPPAKRQRQETRLRLVNGGSSLGARSQEPTLEPPKPKENKAGRRRRSKSTQSRLGRGLLFGRLQAKSGKIVDREFHQARSSVASLPKLPSRAISRP